MLKKSVVIVLILGMLLTIMGLGSPVEAKDRPVNGYAWQDKTDVEKVPLIIVLIRIVSTVLITAQL